MRKYDVGRFLATVRENAATFAMLVPTMIYDIAAQDQDAVTESLSTVRLIGTGGAPISPERLAQAVERLGARFVVAYGLTEACASGTALFPDDYWSRAGCDTEKLRTVGRPWPSVTIRVLDESWREVPHDAETAGEIVISGPSVATGYFGAADDSDTFRSGAVFSGDLGVVYPDGTVRVVDRRKDLIIAGGINVVPREVEEAIGRDPRVQLAAVVGVPHSRLGECVVAFVVPVPGVALTDTDVLDWCTGLIAPYKRPKHILVVDSLPHNSTGKLLKRELIALASRAVAARS